MKTRIALLALTALAAGNICFGKGPSGKFATLNERVECGVKNYSLGLQSENVGLVESCIEQIARLKLEMPAANTSVLQKQLDQLSVSHPSVVVRYKAYIASSVCADPLWFSEDKIRHAPDHDQFFINAGQRLQDKVFGVMIL